jgi:hypothetical protein
MVRSATGGQEDRINPKAFDAFRQISQGGTRRPDQALYDRRAFGELRNEGHVLATLMVESGRGRLRRKRRALRPCEAVSLGSRAMLLRA